MKFFELVPKTNIDFLRYAPVLSTASAVVVGALFVLWMFWGFNLSIEFRGGTALQVELPEAKPEIGIGEVRSAMADVGYPNATVVTFGGAAQSYLITLDISEEVAATTRRSAEGAAQPEAPAPAAAEPAPGAADGAAPPPAETPAATPTPAPATPEAAAAAAKPEGSEAAAAPGAEPKAESSAVEKNTLAGQVLYDLETKLGTRVVTRSIESVGPRVGGELTRSGFLALFITSVGILLYVAARFDALYAPGAVIAVVHDVAITAGLFVLFRLEFDLQVLAALLVVLGFSINDTIVIYDRIRENVEIRGTTRFRDVVNQSLNETLSRTLLTSLTVLLVVLSLLSFGGPVLRPLSIALTLGVISGTYSTVYIASALLVYLYERRAAKATRGSSGSHRAARAQQRV
jgi:preprotein translocase subunit SecF